MAKSTPLAVPASERLIDLMQFVAFTNQFRATERTAWFKGADSPERDGEHSYQVDIVAWYMNDRWNLGFNPLLLSEYAKVHDLWETYAKDTPAFPDLLGHIPAPERRTKKRRECSAMNRIEREWGRRFPALINRMKAYESQKDSESRFIYALEKLVVTVNIYQDGGRTYKRVGATFDTLDKYKTPRVRRHKAVKVLYDEMRNLLKENEGSLFTPPPDSSR